MIKDILVLGAGSAGLLAAVAIKRKIPEVRLRVVRSPDIGVIGVGESTTPAFPKFMFEYLGITRKHFYSTALPTWKMGIHFPWGPRESFEYAFEPALDAKWSDLPKPNGYYCNESFYCVNTSDALMAYGKAFRRLPDGRPDIPSWAAFHLYNPRLVECLEIWCRLMGIEFIDGKITGAVKGPQGIAAVIMEDGRKIEADYFIDATGFRAELLGKTLEEPFISFDKSLFTDRAIVGSWDRTNEHIYPYTVAETMDAGWCWQIDHEHAVNRGYVYCSRFLSDDEARGELVRKNPRIKPCDHVIKFRSGRYRRGWAGNVLAVGNASGFVEPLEATALMVLCTHLQTFCELLRQSDLAPTDSVRGLYNDIFAATWDEVRDFISIHYRFNTRLNTNFWKTCRAEVDVSGCAELLKFYEDNGPTGLCRHRLRNISSAGSQFGIEGFLVLLVGQRVPYHTDHTFTDNEWAIWKRHCAEMKAMAENGVDVKEALQWIRHANWRWNGE